MPVTMTAAERDRLVAAFESGANEFRLQLEGVTAAQSAFKPAPDSWSILECAEHVGLAEVSMRDGLMAATELDPASDGACDDAFWRGGTPRTRPFPPPSNIIPRGDASMVAVIEAFFRERQVTFDLLDSAEWAVAFSGVAGRLVAHPVGQIDAYRCLIPTSQHPIGHSLQIAEIKRHPNYAAV